jgi:hypothetical protein
MRCGSGALLIFRDNDQAEALLAIAGFFALVLLGDAAVAVASSLA